MVWACSCHHCALAVDSGPVVDPALRGVMHLSLLVLGELLLSPLLRDQILIRSTESSALTDVYCALDCSTNFREASR